MSPVFSAINLRYRIGWTHFLGLSGPMLRRYPEHSYWQEIEEANKDWRRGYNPLSG